MALREYMRGLVDGGPIWSGHRTPGVIVTLPVTGTSEMAVRANAWQIAQQSRPAIALYDFFCRTAEVQVNQVESEILHNAGGVGHDLGIAAEELG